MIKNYFYDIRIITNIIACNNDEKIKTLMTKK